MSAKRTNKIVASALTLATVVNAILWAVFYQFTEPDVPVTLPFKSYLT